VWVGIKKGIVEVADIVVVNKSDGDLVPAARRIQTEYTSALKFVRPKTREWRPQVSHVLASLSVFSSRLPSCVASGIILYSVVIVLKNL